MPHVTLAAKRQGTLTLPRKDTKSKHINEGTEPVLIRYRKFRDSEDDVEIPSNIDKNFEQLEQALKFTQIQSKQNNAYEKEKVRKPAKRTLSFASIFQGKKAFNTNMSSKTTSVRNLQNPMKNVWWPKWPLRRVQSEFEVRRKWDELGLHTAPSTPHHMDEINRFERDFVTSMLKQQQEKDKRTTHLRVRDRLDFMDETDSVGSGMKRSISSGEILGKSLTSIDILSGSFNSLEILDRSFSSREILNESSSSRDNLERSLSSVEIRDRSSPSFGYPANSVSSTEEKKQTVYEEEAKQDPLARSRSLATLSFVLGLQSLEENDNPEIHALSAIPEAEEEQDFTSLFASSSRFGDTNDPYGDRNFSPELAETSNNAHQESWRDFNEMVKQKSETFAREDEIFYREPDVRPSKSDIMRRHSENWTSQCELFKKNLEMWSNMYETSKQKAEMQSPRTNVSRRYSDNWNLQEKILEVERRHSDNWNAQCFVTQTKNKGRQNVNDKIEIMKKEMLSYKNNCWDTDSESCPQDEIKTSSKTSESSTESRVSRTDSWRFDGYPQSGSEYRQSRAWNRKYSKQTSLQQGSILARRLERRHTNIETLPVTSRTMGTNPEATLVTPPKHSPEVKSDDRTLVSPQFDTFRESVHNEGMIVSPLSETNMETLHNMHNVTPDPKPRSTRHPRFSTPKQAEEKSRDSDLNPLEARNSSLSHFDTSTNRLEALEDNKIHSRLWDTTASLSRHTKPRPVPVSRSQSTKTTSMVRPDDTETLVFQHWDTRPSFSSPLDQVESFASRNVNLSSWKKGCFPGRSCPAPVTVNGVCYHQ